ncbi:hypothetical protein Tco_0855317 [Tanacetum coccineum]
MVHDDLWLLCFASSELSSHFPFIAFPTSCKPYPELICRQSNMGPLLIAYARSQALKKNTSELVHGKHDYVSFDIILLSALESKVLVPNPLDFQLMGKYSVVIIVSTLLQGI